MSILCGIFGLLTNYASQQMASDEYQETISEAGKTLDYDEKVRLYESAILVSNKAGEKDAYEGMIKLFKEDSVYDTTEEKILIKALKNNQDALKDNVDNYVDIYFETGKLYWYYYDYGENSISQVTRAKNSIEWFQGAIDNAPADYPNLGLARVYHSIGVFFRDIDSLKQEVDDRGVYQPFFQQLSGLMDVVCEDEAESEIVKLELLELVRYSLHKYATDFKKDGVTEEEMLTVFDKMKGYLEEITTTMDITDEMKAKSTNLLEDTRNSIINAYGTTKEDS